MKWLSRFLCALLVAVVLVGCNQQVTEQPPVGSSVTVQFRRDALGSANANAVPPTTDSINGAAVSMGGSLTKVNKDWVVIESGGKTFWIPKSAVLLIRVNK
jgi:hypothetical protein